MPQLFSRFFPNFAQTPAAHLRTLCVTPVCRGTPVKNRCSKVLTYSNNYVLNDALVSTTTEQAVTRKFLHREVPAIMLQSSVCLDCNTEIVCTAQQTCLIFCGKKFHFRPGCLRSWQGFCGFPQSPQANTGLNPSKHSGYKARPCKIYRSVLYIR
jgi:hypothetical protein